MQNGAWTKQKLFTFFVVANFTYLTLEWIKAAFNRYIYRERDRLAQCPSCTILTGRTAMAQCHLNIFCARFFWIFCATPKSQMNHVAAASSSGISDWSLVRHGLRWLWQRLTASRRRKKLYLSHHICGRSSCSPFRSSTRRRRCQHATLSSYQGVTK